MLELAEKSVDGIKYEFQQFGAKESLKTLMRLSKILGKPIALALGSLGEKVDFSNVKGDLLADAAQALTERLDQDEVLNLIQLLTADKVLCEGKKVSFDLHYQGRLDHLFKVLGAALEVQYGNFFGAFKDLIVPGNHPATTQAP